MASVRLGIVAAIVLVGCQSIQDAPPAASAEVAGTVVGARPAVGAGGLQVLHVDERHPNASDGNRGTPGAPLATIARAVAIAKEAAQSGLGTRILIHPGTYRESVELSGDGGASAPPLEFVATGPGVVVSGSDVWRGWRAQGGGVYVHRWPYGWGLAPIPPEWGEIAEDLQRNPIVRRREMIFVDGRPLTQVLSRRKLDDRAGTLFVSEARGRVFIRPPHGISIPDARVEVAVRPHLFLFEGMSNVTVRGLTFVHANTQLNAGHAVAFVQGSSNILVEDGRIVWNNTGGLGLSEVRDATVRGTVSNHNGIGGFEAYRVSNLLMQDNVTSSNNWRGHAGHFDDWASGQKLSGLRGATILGHRSIGNLTHGLWLDSDNVGVLIRGMVSDRNLLDGLVLEASQGPTTVERSRFCANRRGVMSQHAEGVSLDRNVLAANREWGILITGASDRPRPVTDWETGEVLNLYSRDWSLRSNTVSGSNGGQLLIGTSLAPAGSWDTFVETLDSDGNSWRQPVTDLAFGVAGWVRVDFAEWQGQTGQDSSSTFDGTTGSGGTACSAPTGR